MTRCALPHYARKPLPPSPVLEADRVAQGVAMRSMRRSKPAAAPAWPAASASTMPRSTEPSRSVAIASMASPAALAPPPGHRRPERRDLAESGGQRRLQGDDLTPQLGQLVRACHPLVLILWQRRIVWLMPGSCLVCGGELHSTAPATVVAPLTPAGNASCCRWAGHGRSGWWWRGWRGRRWPERGARARRGRARG